MKGTGTCGFAATKYDVTVVCDDDEDAGDADDVDEDDDDDDDDDGEDGETDDEDDGITSAESCYGIL